jgi:nuclear pore complex protein Nup107
MAPTTRRSQQPNGVKSVKKAPARKTRANSGKDAPESWDLSITRTRSGETYEASRAQDNRDESNERNENMQTALVPAQSLDDAIHPLREMAEKVGREVETFAEDLDKFLESLSSRNKFEAVLDLVDSFKNVAQDAAAALEENHRKELSQQLREEWRPEITSSSTVNTLGPLSSLKHAPFSTTKARHVQALRNWQQEADIWELFRIVLEVHHNPDKESIRRRKERAISDLGPPHRYTDEGELWTRFLIDNDVARERSKIKSWLEQAVDHQHSDLPDITQELETKAGRGKGLWANGWLHTREKVKHEKRLRPWSNRTDANPPQIKRSDNGESLITQLDPDATTRQNRSLESQDEFFEQAMWIACWEMLRRGKTWEEVSEWCSDRKEGWRALAVGRAADSSSAVSNVVWRKMCYAASQSECCNKYEAAVYGLLGGNAAAVQKVCRTVDEQLYAYYSATLSKQFDQYLAAQFPNRVPNQRPSISEDDLKNPQDAIAELIVKLRSQNETSRESGQPMKIVQSYLLANEAESLVHTIGFALSDNDKLTKKSADEEMMVRLGQLDSMPEAEAAVDPHVLRITAHIGIILNVLSSDMLEGDERDAEENVLVAYIQALRAARKRDLIPLYASRLQLARYVVSISRVMQDITEVREQEQTLKLLENYRLDIVMILKEQLAFLLNRLTSKSSGEQPFVLLEPTSIDTLYPGKRIIAGALPTEFTSEDEAVVQSLKWFHIMYGRWNETFQALSHALRRCLRKSLHGVVLLCIR